MNIQYAYTILYVEDVAQSMHFYNSVFGFDEKFITPEKDYGEMASGPTTLAFANLSLATSNFEEEFAVSSMGKPPFGIELAFTTDDVAGLMAKALSQGAHSLADLKTKPWGQQVAYLKDPNGFILEICTPMPSS